MRFILACRLFLRLHTKEVGKDLGAAGAMKALRTNPLDKYQHLSMAFRKRHGLGLSTEEKEEAVVFRNCDDGKIERNEEYLDSEVWWEEQRKQKGGRKGVNFPIRLGSVLMRRRQWVKSPLDDSDLESEEGEAQDEPMENSFDGRSSDLESEENSEEGTTHDFSVSTHLHDYKYQNEEEKGIENDGCDDLNDEWDVQENGDEWVQKDDEDEWDFEETDVHWNLEDKCHFQDEDERWDHQVDKCDFEEKDWSDDDETETNEDPTGSSSSVTPVEQWGCSKDPPDGSNWSCTHRYGGIHDQSNQKKFLNCRKKRVGEFDEEEQSEGVWDRDEDEWRFSRKLLEDDNSEEDGENYVNSNNEDIWNEDESSVGYEESDEPWNYDNSGNDDHHDVTFFYSHKEEIDFVD